LLNLEGTVSPKGEYGPLGDEAFYLPVGKRNKMSTKICYQNSTEEKEQDPLKSRGDGYLQSCRK